MTDLDPTTTSQDISGSRLGTTVVYDELIRSYLIPDHYSPHAEEVKVSVRNEIGRMLLEKMSQGWMPYEYHEWTYDERPQWSLYDGASFIIKIKIMKEVNQMT